MLVLKKKKVMGRGKKPVCAQAGPDGFPSTPLYGTRKQT